MFTMNQMIFYTIQSGWEIFTQCVMWEIFTQCVRSEKFTQCFREEIFTQCTLWIHESFQFSPKRFPKVKAQPPPSPPVQWSKSFQGERRRAQSPVNLWWWTSGSWTSDVEPLDVETLVLNLWWSTSVGHLKWSTSGVEPLEVETLVLNLWLWNSLSWTSGVKPLDVEPLVLNLWWST